MLAKTEMMVSIVATTDKMDIDKPTTRIMPAVPPAVKDHQLPLLDLPAGALVVHGVACAGPFTHKIQEVEKPFRGRGGLVIGM